MHIASNKTVVIGSFIEHSHGKLRPGGIGNRSLVLKLFQHLIIVPGIRDNTYIFVILCG